MAPGTSLSPQRTTNVLFPRHLDYQLRNVSVLGVFQLGSVWITPLVIVTKYPTKATQKTGFIVSPRWRGTVHHGREVGNCVGYQGKKQREMSLWVCFFCFCFYPGWTAVHEKAWPVFKVSLPQLKLSRNTHVEACLPVGFKSSQMGSEDRSSQDPGVLPPVIPSHLCGNKIFAANKR